MKIQIFILIALLLLAILISLGGCVASNPQQEPWMFYQACNVLDEDSPAPFFLTMGEAQEYCNRMNDKTNKYQVSFIAR